MQEAMTPRDAVPECPHPRGRPRRLRSQLQYSFDGPGWNTGDCGPIGNIFCYHRTGTNHGVLADRHAGEDGRIRPNACTTLDRDRSDGPISVGVGRTVGAGGTRILVVSEHHAVADEYIVLDRHAFAEEGMGRDLAPPADLYAFVYL